MISASKSTLSQNNLRIFRPKVTKNLRNFCKKFCDSPPRAFAYLKSESKHVDEIDPRLTMIGSSLSPRQMRIVRWKRIWSGSGKLWKDWQK